MMKKLLIAAVLSIAGLGVASAQDAAPAANSVSFSGGASTVQETFQDWTVSCGVQNSKKICSVSQQQMQNNGQRVMAIEVIPSATDSKINLVLPFGLRLAEGMTYRIDNGAPATTAFNTCYPGGCVANLPLTNQLVSGLKSGQNLILVGKAFDGGQDVTLTVSLKGFSAGLDRAVALQQ
ncbi:MULTISPECIES: invasion associated locus B family protein [unclassified Bartonella]|uniref:invasion associated locus B family protein n=1 Tax=unclassified Bartonella TaxID=2645622 RepID=UPI0015FE5117|nr:MULTISPECIES: invasion associated locus B family protein [unclassified Bartonella]UXN03646.1 invasion associated locus B family protein [Bartonella sp. HY406]UXN06619.1 invasion associated locus B family protein [Bartonella sp. HY761]